jgi:hypothetical protein
MTKVVWRMANVKSLKQDVERGESNVVCQKKDNEM